MKALQVVPAAMALLLLGGHPALAFKVMTDQYGKELRWPSLPMPFNIHNAAAPGVSSTATFQAIRSAYQTWSSVSCSTFKSQDNGLVNMPAGNQNDHVNTHSFPSSWSYSQNALGVTLTIYTPGTGKILDADVQYNPYRTWSTTGASSAIDIQAVVTHEIGHQLGLDHSSDPNATMYYATGAGNLGPRSLHSDDISGLCYLYPSGGSTAPECTKDQDCAQGEVCQNSKCVQGSTATKGYGSPCSAHTECLSGLCLKDSSAGITFCSDFCDSKACPNSDQCLSITDSTGKTWKVCYPGSNTWYTKDLGASCQSGEPECKKGLYCVTVSGKGTLCASQCTVSNDTCPTNYVCTQYQSSSGVIGLCIPGQKTPVTPPVGTKVLGETCTANTDCVSKLCLDMGKGKICTGYCDPKKTAPCATGYICIAIPGQTAAACAKDTGTTPNPKPPNPTVKGKLGAVCQANSDCESNICASDGDAKFCTKLCTGDESCGTGYECVPAGSGKNACWPAVASSMEDGGGCGVARAPRGSLHGLLLAGLALLLLLGARRNRD